MKIYCPTCGIKLTKSINGLDLEKEDNGTSIPLKCICGATGFTSFMKVDENRNVITIQMIRK